ncbi:natural cytotoxicity triggering receptor 3-like [Carettochelys insculpta]|uniref:natural cytotoxicity triggering receptor 3-like n=1 Tax=Carettochelys insculpta TaxID=44489 RepID=UPI003EB99EC3
MERLPAATPGPCILLLLLLTWAAADAEIPAGCRSWTPNDGRKAGALGVSQEPRSWNATAGDNVTLSCTFPARAESRVKVVWFRGCREEVVLDAAHPFYRGRLRTSSLAQNSQGKATLALAELEARDSGCYRCCVEIYNATAGTGAGTQLSVTWRDRSVTGDGKEPKPDAGTELIIYRAAIALAGLGLLALLTALLLRQRTAAATETQRPAKGPGRAGATASEGLSYAEIAFKAPAHTEYASIRTQRL